MAYKILKMMGWIFLATLLIISIYAIYFVNSSPQFGGAVSAAQKKSFAKSAHHKDGIFVNEIPTVLEPNMGKVLKQWLSGMGSRGPKTEIPTLKLDSNTVVKPQHLTSHLTWLGHSSFLLEMDGLNILLDPMLGKYAAPHPWIAPERYAMKLPISGNNMPYVDAVIYSHDHYDHLDYDTVLQIKDKVGHFYVPLGLGNHLRLWGVDASKISEYNWWERSALGRIELVCTPARHFSGRGLTDRSATLWASWVIKGSQNSIYFSGDSGYGPHFKEIGEKFGPFDLALMECGQYNKEWEAIHMMPEQSVKAAGELGAAVMLPIHWGAFTLALHSWTEPAARAWTAAKNQGQGIALPLIGQRLNLAEEFPQKKWWENVP